MAAMLFTLSIASGVQGQVLAPRLTTNKGCVETGDDPMFAVDEQIAVSFRIGSATVSQATASIIDHTTDSRIVVLSLGRVATNHTFTFTARVGGPAGNEALVLRADIQGASAQSAPCSFTVVASPTASPQTRTPTATRTPPTGATRTPTPGANLSGELHTSRGCREDGDSATFAPGETITLSFRLASDTASFANASIVDSRPNGVQTVISFGAVPTNLPLLISGRVGLPQGVHTLRLRGGVGGPQTLLDTCSFLAAGDTIPTPTRKPTRTPTRTRAPTRTFTPVPGECVGACTQPDAVTVNDLLVVIRIAAGESPLSACPAADANGDQQVSLEEVLQAVNNAIDGCPGS
ncbi:MAG TPA: hypothetical protein VL049_05080 [Candidatus Dormibacteraeota bacterium]|nr:hypothetical protein [Candidatus Dormibacteraeota bacterium]